MTDKVNALATAKARNPRFASGTKARKVEFRADFTSANSDNGDVIELAGPFSGSDRIASIAPSGVNIPALTSAADNDFGFYSKDEDGNYVELDKDILLDGVDLSSATATNNLLSTMSNANYAKNIGEHLGLTVDQEPHGGIYLCWTMNTANTATATVALDIEVDEATTS